MPFSSTLAPLCHSLSSYIPRCPSLCVPLPSLRLCLFATINFCQRFVRIVFAFLLPLFPLPFPPHPSCLLLGCAWQIFSITFDYHCQLCVCIYVDRSRDPFVLICIGIYSICTCICICICIGICICIIHSPPLPFHCIDTLTAQMI